MTKNGQLLGLITKKDVLRHLSVMNNTSNVLDDDLILQNDFQNLMILPERRMSGYLSNEFSMAE